MLMGIKSSMHFIGNEYMISMADCFQWAQNNARL